MHTQDEIRSIKEEIGENQRIIDELNSRLHRKNLEVMVIQTLTSEINTTLDLNRIFTVTMESLDRTFGFSHSLILLKQRDAEILKVEASHGYEANGKGALVRFGEGVIGVVAKRRKVMRMAGLQYKMVYLNSIDSQIENKTAPVALPGLASVKSQLAIPLVVKDELIGVYAVESSEANAFDSLDELILSIVGNQIGAAISNARAYGELEALSEKFARQEKMATIGDMAAGIIHDLKNPMAIIQGAVEMADDDTIGREHRRELLQIVNQESNRMFSLVQDLLDFSRGAVSISKSTVDVGIYLERIHALLSHAMLTKRVTMVTEPDYSGPANFDPDRLLRAVINIAGNAADAMSAGGEFIIRASLHEGGLLFELSDNGPGIPEEIQETLFLPFVTSGKKQGTGLGMAIAKSMVEAHHGRISFTTEKGRGTSFEIWLPHE